VNFLFFFIESWLQKNPSLRLVYWHNPLVLPRSEISSGWKPLGASFAKMASRRPGRRMERVSETIGDWRRKRGAVAKAQKKIDFPWNMIEYGVQGAFFLRFFF